MLRLIYLILLSIFYFFAIATMSPSYEVAKPKEYVKEQNFADKAERILFIVDFSNSMNEYLGYNTKIDVALDTLENLLPRIPSSKWMGLRVYGHKSGFTQYQGCTASALMVPISQNSSTIINSTLRNLYPKGYTPITYSLKQAVKSDFGDFKGKKRIILLTDGGENCDESPCSYAIELIKTRPDIKIDVIALAVNDYEATSQLRCAALTTSGKFYSAKTAAQLFDSMKNTLEIEKDVQGQIIMNEK